MSKKEKNILHQLVNSLESIRRKYNILKRNKEFIEIAISETFKPLVDPLGEASDATLEASKTLTQADPIISQYIQMAKFRSENIDKLYGVYKNGDNLQLGNTKIPFDEGKILVRNELPQASRGLLEWLFQRNPNMNIVNQDDESY